MRIYRVFLPCLLLLLAELAGYGQTQIDLRTQSKSIDFSAASSTKPFKSGTVLPATCSVGEAFFKTDATAGQNLYVCAAPNVWSQTASGSGAVSSVFGRTGDVTGQTGDYSFAQISGTVSNAQVAGAVDATKLGTGVVDNAEFGYLDGVTAALQTQLNAKASSTHSHTAGGDVTGAIEANTVEKIQGIPVANLVPSDGQVMKYIAVDGQWKPGTIDAIAGASRYELEVTRTSATQLTINPNCSLSAPCNVKGHQFNSPATATLSGTDTGSAWIGLDSSGVIVVRHNITSGNITCTGCTAIQGAAGFAASDVPGYQWPVTSGNWDADQAAFDKRSFLYQKEIAAGVGATVTDSYGMATVGVDTAIIPVIGGSSSCAEGQIIKTATGSWACSSGDLVQGGSSLTAADAIPKVSGPGALTSSGCAIDSLNNLSCPGTMTSGAAGGVTSNIALNGSISGTVNVTVNDAAGNGTIKIPGVNGTMAVTSTAGNFITTFGTNLASPGTVILKNARYLAVRGGNLPIADNDLYTVPAGRRALITGWMAYNTAATAASAGAEIKVGTVYLPLHPPVSITGNTAASEVGLNYVAEPGEILAASISGVAGINIWFNVIEFDNTSGLLTAKACHTGAGCSVSLGAGTNTTLYTAANGANAVVVSPAGLPTTDTAAVLRYINNSASSVDLLAYLVPQGGTADGTNQIMPATTVASGTLATPTLVGTINMGDSIVANVSGNTATQLIYLTIYEFVL